MGPVCSHQDCCQLATRAHEVPVASAQNVPFTSGSGGPATDERYPTLLCSRTAGDLDPPAPARSQASNVKETDCRIYGKRVSASASASASPSASPCSSTLLDLECSAKQAQKQSGGPDQKQHQMQTLRQHQHPDPDEPQLSARSILHLEREAKELHELQGHCAPVRDWAPYTFRSGAVYLGEWNGGTRHGRGRQTWPDGAIYEGQWYRNSASGQGRFVHTNGDVFVGQWQDNAASGMGNYYYKPPKLKLIIVGLSGLPDDIDAYCTCEVPGKAETHLQTQALKVGGGSVWNFEVGMAGYALGDSLAFSVRGRTSRKEDDLLGKARLPSEAFHPHGFHGVLPLRGRRGGSVRPSLCVRVAPVRGAYSGEWCQDRQHGSGVELWCEGWAVTGRYAGEFAEGRKHGVGVYHWEDGSVYEGSWVKNIIEGLGTYRSPDGRCFKGQWRNSYIHGLGRYLWAGGRWYSGEFMEDQKHGFGTFQWPNGRKYEGHWAFGKQHGVGRLTARGNLPRLSLWEDGKRLRDLEEVAEDASTPTS